MGSATRAVGIAESAREKESILAAAVVRADRTVDGLEYGRCTVGGLDATDAARSLLSQLDRPDAQCILLAGIAPAWFNFFELHRLHEHADRPVVSVSFEASEGLGDALAREFDGDALAERRSIYERQPPRTQMTVNGEQLWVRAVGTDDAERIVRGFTPEGGRPEPLRVARLAARAGRRFRTDS
ncbi:MAG: DUF99 family protein [Halobacteriales archaeon]|nr:DUF99 family protein [Halobacteriales archaeon]